ncbi:hypothetical protein KAI04_04695 [Candidatus Pacearchaeota archaeon]|nr:hypothetical protein [Candidatus Pacearchaeota archaeon]
MTKEITPRESMRNLTLSTLERTLIQNTLGANLASDVSKYGTNGAEKAKNAFNREEIKKAKEEAHQELSEQYKSLDIVGEPTYLSNSDFSYQIIQGLESVMKDSYLEDLVEGVKKFNPELEFDIPDKLKGYTYNLITQKAAEEKDGKLMINPKKLSEDEQIALGTYEILKKAYRLSAAEKVINSNYLGNINAELKEVMEKYNPTKESKYSE